LIELLAPHVDFVYIDGEHGGFDWRDVVRRLRGHR
jgi:hypothetical protein